MADAIAITTNENQTIDTTRVRPWLGGTLRRIGVTPSIARVFLPLKGAGRTRPPGPRATGPEGKLHRGRVGLKRSVATPCGRNSETPTRSGFALRATPDRPPP